ncbi:hypothetical protein GO755_33330 [Spirosoma sp. HMF4905]|uniref:Uncharacterized protein n=1 Tax=Spirosoma arboris TaxID=2682092 RepID=A0A7K1SMG1_9BACT|nr:hypothetical protein [Spirosoma arboris]MVM34958.1 hypothetical protein [Spirosoma arboris]
MLNYESIAIRCLVMNRINSTSLDPVRAITWFVVFGISLLLFLGAVSLLVHV